MPSLRGLFLFFFLSCWIDTLLLFSPIAAVNSKNIDIRSESRWVVSTEQTHSKWDRRWLQLIPHHWTMYSSKCFCKFVLSKGSQFSVSWIVVCVCPNMHRTCVRLMHFAHFVFFPVFSMNIGLQCSTFSIWWKNLFHQCLIYVKANICLLRDIFAAIGLHKLIFQTLFRSHINQRIDRYAAEIQPYVCPCDYRMSVDCNRNLLEFCP